MEYLPEKKEWGFWNNKISEVHPTIQNLIKFLKCVGFIWIWYCLGLGIATFIDMFVQDKPMFDEQEKFIGTFNSMIALISTIIIYFLYKQKNEKL